MKICKKGHKYSPDRKQCNTCSHLNYLQKKDKVKEQRRAWDAANPEKVRGYLLKKYGITLDEYTRILKSQRYNCAICKLKETATTKAGKTMKLAIDHCHTSGKIRGLLCSGCNRAIGYLRENPESCIAAAAYLRKHKA